MLIVYQMVWGMSGDRPRRSVPLEGITGGIGIFFVSRGSWVEFPGDGTGGFRRREKRVQNPIDGDLSLFSLQSSQQNSTEDGRDKRGELMQKEDGLPGVALLTTGWGTREDLKTSPWHSRALVQSLVQSRVKTAFLDRISTWIATMRMENQVSCPLDLILI
jgi:hypothetical protein